MFKKHKMFVNSKNAQDFLKMFAYSKNVRNFEINVRKIKKRP